MEHDISEPQLVEVDLMQSSVSGIGEESIGINIDCPLTSAHNYEGIVDVHGTNDVVHVNGGDNNTIAPDNVITPNTKQPTWTRIIRPKSYESTDKHAEQIQKVGQKREFGDSELTLGLETLKHGKRIKHGVCNA